MHYVAVIDKDPEAPMGSSSRRFRDAIRPPTASMTSFPMRSRH